MENEKKAIFDFDKDKNLKVILKEHKQEDIMGKFKNLLVFVALTAFSGMIDAFQFDVMFREFFGMLAFVFGLVSIFYLPCALIEAVFKMVRDSK